jgi:hypothetical protein
MITIYDVIFILCVLRRSGRVQHAMVLCTHVEHLPCSLASQPPATYLYYRHKATPKQQRPAAVAVFTWRIYIAVLAVV